MWAPQQTAGVLRHVSDKPHTHVQLAFLECRRGVDLILQLAGQWTSGLVSSQVSQSLAVKPPAFERHRFPFASWCVCLPVWHEKTAQAKKHQTQRKRFGPVGCSWPF